MEPLIKVEDLHKIYNPGENEVRALDGISLEIQKGEFVAIIGHSGSGKSTLMNICLLYTSRLIKNDDVRIMNQADCNRCFLCHTGR